MAILSLEAVDSEIFVCELHMHESDSRICRTCDVRISQEEDTQSDDVDYEQRCYPRLGRLGCMLGAQEGLASVCA